MSSYSRTDLSMKIESIEKAVVSNQAPFRAGSVDATINLCINNCFKVHRRYFCFAANKLDIKKALRIEGKI